MLMRVENEVLAVLSRAHTTGNALVLVGQLERGLYQKTDKVLEAAGGKWDRKARAHLFPGDAAETVEQIILSGEVARPQDFGAFFSPAPVADRVVELARLQAGMKVLEPNAGGGALASRALRAGCQVDCVELLEKHVSILSLTPYRRVIHADFLTLEPTASYDRVLMNPPFARQDDIRHVRHALGFLKPDGLLVSVMAAGIFFRENRLTTEFRALIDERGGEIEELPEGAFRESGTMVRTVIVTIPAEPA